MNDKKPSILRILFYIIVIGYAIVSLGPYIWSILISFRTTDQLALFSLDPNSFTFNNYTYIWSQFPFVRWTINSLITAAAVTTGNLLINSMAGYALARLEFPGKKLLFIIILALMMIPGQVTLVPTYMLLSKLKWIDNFAGLIIPFMFSLFGTFLMRQFFLSIPKSMEEAALIDGMGRFGIFFKIVLPLARPAMATQFILMFTGNWNSFLYPSLLTSTPEMFTLPVGLNSFYGQYFQFWNQVLAGVMMLSLPTIAVFLIFQKNFIKGIATSGLKY